MALHDRLKPKDAWDLYFCLRHYPGGLDALIAEFRPHVTHGLVHEGLRIVAQAETAHEFLIDDIGAHADARVRPRTEVGVLGEQGS